MSEVSETPFGNVLDPMERISETLFGLIMALTFICSLDPEAIDPERKSPNPSPSLEKLYLGAHDMGLQTLSGNGICHQFAQTKFVERSDGG